jgi:hypothetical protein
MRIVRRATLVLGVGLIATWAMAVPAGAAKLGQVGPKQYFTGVINGTDGNTSNPIPIQMACGGPAAGKTGHPVAGQTLAVHQLFPPASSTGSLGYTGKDSEIEVFFNAPPPATAAARAAKSVVFVRYDKTQRLSTALTLPCSGTGTVYFSPIPVVPPSESASVPVEFENQALTPAVKRPHE